MPLISNARLIILRNALTSVESVIEDTYAHDENGERTGLNDEPEKSAADIFEYVCNLEMQVSEAIDVVRIAMGPTNKFHVIAKVITSLHTLIEQSYGHNAEGKPFNHSPSEIVAKLYEMENDVEEAMREVVLDRAAPSDSSLLRIPHG